MMANSPQARSERSPVTAAQPTSGGAAPGRAADDDVVRSRALEPLRVDEDIEEVASEGQRGGDPVDRKSEQQHRGDREADAERQRGVRADRGRQRRRDFGCGPSVRRYHGR